ncbi:conserved Plasmodium protein, unknown function [Plasmodium sp. gorilla clade G3]|nr:conserved Plasmodium protein, unknown function [Plasmodium sp. gorilla clade G3]
MDNFMIRIKANNEEVNDFIKCLFTETFCNKNFDDDIKLDAQRKNEKQENEKKNRYIITKKYVDNYMIPYLIRNKQSKEEKRNENIHSYDDNNDNINNNNNNNNYNNYYYFYNDSYNCDIFKYISCDINIGCKNIVSKYRNTIEDDEYKERIQFELYGTKIYFKNMINEKYKIKYNKYNKEYREYNIKDKSVLLIYGNCYMCDTFMKNKRSNISIKELYDYIEENIKNINDIFNCLKGSFILCYIHYDITNINVYFFNDKFGMKSFLYFYEQKSIIITNMYGPFLNYNFNYIQLNKNEFIFDDMSVKDDINLIPLYDTFVQHDNTENNFLTDKKTCDYNLINNKLKNIVSKERDDDKCRKKTINEEIAINIMPHYIYKLIFLNNNEKNKKNNDKHKEDNIFNIHNYIMLIKINKKHCIYDNSYYQWKQTDVDKFNILNFQDILHYFEKNNIFKNFNKQQKIQFLHTINKIIQEKNEHIVTQKENITFCQTNNFYNNNNNKIITYTKLNNVFINLFIILLNHIIRQKIKHFFHLTCSGKKEDKMKKGKNEKNLENKNVDKNQNVEENKNIEENKNVDKIQNGDKNQNVDKIQNVEENQNVDKNQNVEENKNVDGNEHSDKSHIKVEEHKNDNINIPYYPNKEKKGTEKCIGIFFSGGIDSTLLTILTIKNFFPFYQDGYIELVNVVFNINAIDRYTCFLSYEKIISMFPKYDIRLILVDVYADDLIKYEKIIYSIISPNNKIMDYNISSALFFANLGRGILCPRTFFESQEWKNIKEENLINVLNISDISMSDKHTSDNNLWEENSFDKKISIKGKRKKETTLSSKNINILYKCRICKYIMNKKCVHKCCSVCCKKLRYIYINENINNMDKESDSKRCDNIVSLNCEDKIYNINDDDDDKRNNHEKDFIGMYEIHYNKENRNKKNIYLIVKKERILINFELFRHCIIHKDKLYDYKKIGYLFSVFHKELKEEKMKKMEMKYEEFKEKNDHGEILKNNKHSLCNEEYIQRDFIHQFASNITQKNEKHNIEKIKNLFSSKEKNKKEGNKKKIYQNKMFINNDIIYNNSNQENNDEKEKKKEKKNEKKNEKKKEKKKFIYNDNHLNYFNKNIYYPNHNYFNEKEKSFYMCNHQLLIIGSGADELFGGYYRQNNFNKKLAKINKNYKMCEMIKDIRRIWIRNLYRDDRVISFSSFKKKYIFYPYLDMLMVHFLFSLPFCIIETPMGYINNNEDDINKCYNNEKLNYDDEEILLIEQVKDESYNTFNKKYMDEDTLICEEQFNYLNAHILNECNNIYERMKTQKINKWILRMSIYFLNFKDVMFFKKKAIQFGSKSKNVKRYMKESLGTYPKDSENNSRGLLAEKSGKDEYILLS